MFHILIENSTPNRLVGGPWESIRPESRSEVVASTVECGMKGGTIREAITQQEYRTLSAQGKLHTERCCKSCLQKVGGKYRGKRKDSEATERA